MIVTGKGGTGKTSITASLALAGLAAGKRVLVAEMGLEETIPRLLAPGSPAVGYEGRILEPGLTVFRIDPFLALNEYLALRLRGMGSAFKFILRNKSFLQLLEAAPGWRELITLGKIWYMHQKTQADGSPLYELIIVDAPATGHGITFLDVPRVAISAIRSGPLRRHAGWVDEMITDPKNTCLLPVTLAEELPAREVSEMIQRLRSEARIVIDRVVVNNVMPRPMTKQLEPACESLEQLPRDLVLPGLPTPAVLQKCVRHLYNRYELNQHYLKEVQQHTQLPVVPLPHLSHGITGREDLSALVQALIQKKAARQ